VHQRDDGRQVPLRYRLRHGPRAAALGAAVGAAVLFGCGSGDAPARSTTTTTRALAPKPQLYAAPVVVKIGTTFEVRVRFKRALPLSKNNGVRAEFSIGPSTTDHDPVKMKGSTGFCYRQTLYNDLDRDSLKRLHAGSRATLEIVVHGQPPKIVRRVTLASDVNAVPPGCKLSPKPGPG
jgi:hypothetical protein